MNDEEGFFSQRARTWPMSERKARIKARQEISVRRQCGLLAVPRSRASVRSQPLSEPALELMKQLDARSLQWPFYGSRRLCVELQHRGDRVNRKRVQRLMRKMRIQAIYPKPRTSQPGKGHKSYPYRLRGLTIDRPNQVWASDICYIADGNRLHVFDGDHGRVFPTNAGVAGFKYIGHRGCVSTNL